jgi:O-antigen/teichoic acid export membrane protein
MLRADRPGRSSGRWSFAFGLLDQSLSSATNLGLTLLAGRLLGPSGLGTVFVAFSFYIVALGVQRALLTTPLVAAMAARSDDARKRATEAGLTIVFIGGALMTLAFVGGGLLIPVSGARGLLLFVPWLLPSLVQDYWRAVLFQERRGGQATLNDFAWAIGMGAIAAVAYSWPSQFSVVSAWGAGATAGAVLGFFQVRRRPALPRSAARWWLKEVWPFGRWLGAEVTLYSAISWGTVLTLAAVLGAYGLGGLQAAQSLFAPLSLLSSAVTLPGLPAVTRALAVSFSSALRLAVRISVAVVGLAFAYVLLAGAGGGGLLAVVFGSRFRTFHDLIYPIGAWQLAAAAGVGLQIFIRSQQRGRALFLTRLCVSIVGYCAITTLAATHGVSGAAWGFAIGSATETVLLAAIARRSYGHMSNGVTARSRSSS